MKLGNLIAIAVLLVAAFAAAQGPVSADTAFSSMATDPILGEPFKVRGFDAGENKQYHATIIKYAPEKDSSWSYAGKALYIHGFNDYFFQRELAEKLDSAHYEFYAIDLHKYGRSLRPGERIGEVLDIAEYYAELDSIIVEMRGGNPDQKIVLIGHSTGGLIAALYAAARGNGKDFESIVLNSPFMEMNYGFITRDLLIPAVSFLGRFFPNIDIPRGDNTNYGESIHKSYRGEWEYNTDIKSLSSITVNTGWLRAIHLAHHDVQKGLKLEVPVLVMHSNCNIDQDEWSDDYMHCDGVLDVEHIRRYGANLGDNVKLVEITGGMHDLILSRKDVRDNVYKVMLDFMDASMPAEIVPAEP